MSAAFRDIARALLATLFPAPRRAPKVDDGDQPPLQLDVRGHDAERPGCSPVRGDSHAFLGSAFTTLGRSNA